MVDTSGLTNTMFGLLSSAFFWVILGLALILFMFAFLIIRKHRSLSHIVHEVIDVGRDKVNINTKSKSRVFRGKLKGGWFKDKSRFFGLWDYGTKDVFKTNDGRKIFNLASTDFHEINGKLAVIAQRSDEDPNVLVPISQVKCTNKQLLSSIAPAEYQSVAVDLIKATERETADFSEKLIHAVIFGFIIVFALVAVIMIIQMVQNGQREAGQLILDAGNIKIEGIREIVKQVVQELGIGESTPSGAP